MAKRKQLQIAGTEPQAIAEVDEAALEYVQVRDERMELTNREIAARDALTEVTQKHALRAYHFADGDVEYSVELAETTKPKVKRKGGQDEGAAVGD